jgi:hypothetical protein
MINKVFPVVFVQFGSEESASNLRQFVELCELNFPDSEFDCIVVDNKPDSTYFHRIKFPKWNFEFYQGSNERREFSAWDLGLRTLRKRHIGESAVICATSAFNKSFTDYLPLFGCADRIDFGIDPFILGHIDYFDKPFLINSESTDYWIRTGFFISTLNTLLTLETLASHLTPFELATMLENENFLEYGFDSDYFAYLSGWLSGKIVSQGSKWHSVLERSSHYESEYIQKILCIISEHSLTTRLVSKGVEVYDVGFLHQFKDQLLIPKLDWINQVNSRRYGLKIDRNRR